MSPVPVRVRKRELATKDGLPDAQCVLCKRAAPVFTSGYLAHVLVCRLLVRQPLLSL